MKRALLLLSLVACTGLSSEDIVVEETSAAQTSEPSIAFGLNNTVQPRALVPNKAITVTYDVRRLTTCGPSAKLELFYLTNSGHSHVTLGTEGIDANVASATIGPFNAGDLSIWFHTTNGAGCEDWDSAHGHNYHFAIGDLPTYEQVAPMIAQACKGCHGTAFDSLDKLKTRKAAMLGRISSGSMPRNNPGWRDTPDGRAVVSFLRDVLL